MRQKSTKKRQYSIVGIAMIVSLVLVFLAAAPALADTFNAHKEADPDVGSSNQLRITAPEPNSITYSFRPIATGPTQIPGNDTLGGRYFTPAWSSGAYISAGTWTFHTWLQMPSGAATYFVKVYRNLETLNPIFQTTGVAIPTGLGDAVASVTDQSGFSIGAGERLRVEYWANVSAIPQTGSQTALPTSNGTLSGTWTVYPTSPTTRWDKVDDPVGTPDDATSYIRATAVGLSLFGYPAFNVPTGSTINDLTIYYRHYRSGTSSSNIRSALRVGGTNYNTTDPGVTPTNGSWNTASYSWTQNPKTSAAWTAEQINGTAGTNQLQEWGVYAGTITTNPRVTQVYAIVNYEQPVSMTIDNATANTQVVTPAIILPPPNTPTIGTPAASGTNKIQWNFTDTNTTEDGFKVNNSLHTVEFTRAVPNATFVEETGLSPNTLYTGRHIHAYNAAGNSPASADAAACYTLSTNPASIAASDGTFTDKIRVSWPASASAVRYDVYKDGSNLTGTRVYSNTGLTFDDMSPTPGPHTYRVYSVNSANVLNTIDSAVSDTGYKMSAPPYAPTIGTPTATSTTSIRWNFTDTNNNEDGFKVHDSGHTREFTRAVPNATFVEETGLSPNTLYTGRHVHAYNTLGNSPASGPASSYTLSNPPTGANASDGVFLGHIHVSWTAPADANPPNHYHVYRDGTSGSGTLLPDVFTTSIDDDPGDPDSHTYYIYSVNSNTPGAESSSYTSNSGYAKVASGYAHGGYSDDTSACASCHRAHTAKGAYLMAESNSALCKTCHWAAVSADTDVKNGVYNTAGEYNHYWGIDNGTLLAGGFVKVDATGTATSMHKMDTPLKPPGSTTGDVITLGCTSCHSPHMSNGSESQYRLLRLRPNGAASAKVVAWNGPWTNNTQTTYQAGGYRAYTEKDWNPYLNGVQTYTHNYKSGLSDWCVSCHTVYKTPVDSAPYDPGDPYGAEIRYRHTMDNMIKGVTDETTGFTYNLDSELPLEQVNGSEPSNQDKIMCLTCHRAHGTDATITDRIAEYYDIDRGSLPKGSTLLRRNNTSVCVDCHTDI